MDREFLREREQVALLLDETIRGYLSDAGVPEVNDTLEAVYGRFAIGTETQTREMRFFIEDARVFTAEFIRRLQRDVLQRYERWSLVPQFNERELTLFHDSVLLGKQRIKGSVSEQTPEFRQWTEETKGFDERRNGPLRRQVAYVRRVVTAALSKLTNEPYAVLAIFDRFRPEMDGIAIWMLEQGNQPILHLDSEITPALDCAVGSNGEIFPQFCEQFSPLSERSPAAWLVAYVVDEAAPGQSFAVHSEDGRELGRIATSPVIRDEELQRGSQLG